MLNSKKGVDSVLKFIIGLLLAAAVIVFFSKLIYSCINLEDKSSKTFPKLADKIETLSQSSALQKNLDPVFIYVGEKEVILFFDKEENYSVYLRGIFDLDSKDVFFNYKKEPVIYYYNQIDAGFREAMETGIDYAFKSNILYVFEKPSTCEDSACMVLCPKKKLNSVLYQFYKVSFSNYDIRLPNVFLITCPTPKRTMIFDKVNKFYRKPFLIYGLVPGKDTEEPSSQELNINSVILGGSFLSSKFFCPDWAYKPSRGISKDLKKAIKETGKAEVGVAFDAKCALGNFEQVAVAEHADPEQDVALISGQFLYTQAFNHNIVMCYAPPCISMTDELFIKWDVNVDACSDSSEECDALSADIKKESERNKIVFKTAAGTYDRNILNIKHGVDDFFYNKDLFLVISSKDESGDELKNYVDELSLEYDSDAANKVLLEAKGIKYSFIGTSSEIKYSKPSLKFIVKEYKPST